METRRVVILLLAGVAGAALDFLFNGVLKIIWFLVYGPAYAVAAIVLSTQLSRSRWKEFARPATIAFLAGAALGHLGLVGRHHSLVYTMSLTQTSPVVLRSAEWPQALFVVSDKLSQELAQHPVQKGIPVLVDAVTDYGCIRTAPVRTVDGIDVMNDHDASWTWKTEHGAPSPSAGPGTEDQLWPWCQIQFYRTH